MTNCCCEENKHKNHIIHGDLGDACKCIECSQRREDRDGHGIVLESNEKAEKNTDMLLENVNAIRVALEQLVKEVKMLRAP